MKHCVIVLVFLWHLQAFSASELADIRGNLEGVWAFKTDPQDVGTKEEWFAPGFDDAAWRTIKVPGMWEPQAESPTDPLANYDGVAWYRLHFIVPAAWSGADLELALGRVDDEDITYFNGQIVGKTGPRLERAVLVRRVYGVPAKAVKFGAENVLAVRVTDLGGTGGMPGPMLYLLPKEKAKAMTTLPQADRPLAERFAVPPAQSRILKIIHGQPDAPDDQDQLRQTLLAEGFGGMVTNVSFDGYVESEPKWRSLIRAINEAKKAGMALWLYDERGYPSGNAGGIVMRDHPEWEAAGIYASETDSDGGEVHLDAPPGKLIRATAIPAPGVLDQHPVDLTQEVHDGKLSWKAPAGSWHVMILSEGELYEGTHAVTNLAAKQPYINLLMPEPTARFIEVTHQAYANHLGDDLGKYFISTFTDEPSLMSLFMKPQPWRVIPWAPNLPVEFEKRRGYAIEPLIPALFCDGDPKAKKARYDFWMTVGELVSENYFGQIRQWCDQHNVLSGGHLLMEEGILTHVPLYGHFFQCARQLTAPSIDCLTSIPDEVPWYSARLLSSAAELEGRAVTMCETSDHCQRYRPEGDTRPVRIVTEDEIRGTCNRLILNGITTITSYYSFTELTTSQLVRLNEYIGRCCTMLAGGRQVADIALLYPAETLWPNFSPAHNWVADSPAICHRVETTYHAASDALFKSQRDFTYIDARTLAEAEAKDGILKYRGLQWRVIVLPCIETLPMKAWENLAQFWRSGGVVIALGALPANSESEFPSPAVNAIAKEMFGEAGRESFPTYANSGAAIYLPSGQESLLLRVMDHVLEPDLVCPPDSPLRVTHRRIDNHEIFFVINDSGSAWKGPVSFAAAGAAEQWNPATGKSAPIEADKITLKLAPYSGMLFRFAEARLPQRHAANEALPKPAFSALPEPKVTCGHGEFVAEEIRHSEIDHTWQAAATLKRGNTDTFLFLGFGYEQPVDIHAAELLSIDIVVPEGQKTSSQLLMMLRDKNGVEYFCNTGRMLNEPGMIPCCCPLKNFQRASWVKGPEGPLDLTAIAAISIGWGGYYGKEGEKVEFTASAPETGVWGKVTDRR